MADLKYLESFASEARKNCLFCIANLGVGHVGGSLSIIEILTYLLNGEMRNLYPDNPRCEDRDMLVVSKGHSGPALYSILAKKGYFPMSWLNTLNQGGTRLPSHCDRNQTPGIDMSTGSLGQGISAACGIAYAAKLKSSDQRTYCIIGDGETEEGQNWEAAMFAKAKGLDNLILITDYNKLQLDGPVAQVLSLDDLETKWRAFGWEVVRCNGHDLKDLDRAFDQCHKRNGLPKMVICDTIKAKGFPRLENKPESHNANISLDEVKELYPGMEDIVDILIDNNIPFSYDGVFELTDENNDVIASAAMIIDNPKIAIDPFSEADKATFEQKGYRVIKQEEFNVNIIK